MSQALRERCAGLICRQLGIAIQDLVDARDGVTGDGPDLLACTAGVVQGGDAGMAQWECGSQFGLAPTFGAF